MKETKKTHSGAATLEQVDGMENATDDALRDDFTTRGWTVASLLPSGRENALSPELLCDVLGFKSKRSLRREVERERRDGALICSSLESGGYFLPGSVDELRRFVRTQQERIETTEACIASAQRLLEEVENGEN